MDKFDFSELLRKLCTEGIPKDAINTLAAITCAFDFIEYFDKMFGLKIARGDAEKILLESERPMWLIRSASYKGDGQTFSFSESQYAQIEGAAAGEVLRVFHSACIELADGTVYVLNGKVKPGMHLSGDISQYIAEKYNNILELLLIKGKIRAI